ncbi:MAG: tRNA-dihydrouridine synthase, partial [Synergistaceae bacterium]|nr:tRNA-dihydrouridine synthase [Synergistaceae bacterium]
MLIGGLELKNNLCLAPLAGITTLPVREFFSDLGAALTHTEMISCAGLNHDNAKTFDMLKTSEFEAPLV